MSTSKFFHRKTKRGKIIKVVREHYLRDDLHCGKENCSKCESIKIPPDSPFAPPTYLDSTSSRLSLSGVFTKPHYIVPDFEISITQVDCILDPDFGDNIILLETVIDDLKRNVSVYARFKEVMKSRKIYVFCNEHHRETYEERKEGQSTEEYKKQLIIKAVSWLEEHYANIQVLLLTRKKLHTGSSFKDYVTSLKNSLNLIDKCADLDEENENVTLQQRFYYREHLPLGSVRAGIESGKYYQCKYFTNYRNYLEGSVTIILKNEAVKVLIQGRENINRAFDGDIVAIELLPESEWHSASEIVLLSDDIEEDELEQKTEKISSKESAQSSTTLQPCGKVVSIIRRNWKPVCGVLREKLANINNNSVGIRHLVVPVKRGLPFVSIETRQYETLKNQKIVVVIDNWPRDSKNPKGHYVKALGKSGEEDTEKEALLVENDVPTYSFSNSVLNCLPEENFQIPQEEIRKRLDLRNLCICSVDPPGCTDIDDALHSRDLGNGIYEIGVHIADVSYFIKSATALDNEAATRSTSVYLSDKRIDMIPPLLSSNLCSLHENSERLAFSVICQLKAETAEVLSCEFVKTVICSKGALQYKQAQLIIDDKNDQSELAKGLRRLNDLAKILKAKRMEKGALTLASPGEVKFVEVESETHENTFVIESKEMLETNYMVEEFMLLANILVAEKIYDEFPEFALLRQHPKPSQSNFGDLIRAAKSKNYEMQVNSGHALSRSLKEANEDEVVNLLLRMITTRCMTRARYICSGMESKENFYHFGLAFELYTHFTSPIRRYADLIVHRLLAHAVGAEKLHLSLLSRSKMQSLCDNMNYRHINAQNASRASLLLQKCIFIRNLPNSQTREEAYVFSIKRNAIVLFVPKLAFEVEYACNNTLWDYNEDEGSQLFISTKQKLRQFDEVVIEIAYQLTQTFQKLQVKFLKPLIEDEICSSKKRKSPNS